MKFPTIGHTIYFHEEIKFPYFRLRLFLVADTRLCTLPCRSVRRSHFYIASGFCITAPAQLSATVLPCIRPCFLLFLIIFGCFLLFLVTFDHLRHFVHLSHFVHLTWFLVCFGHLCFLVFGFLVFWFFVFGFWFLDF